MARKTFKQRVKEVSHSTKNQKLKYPGDFWKSKMPKIKSKYEDSYTINVTRSFILWTLILQH